jgi:hypothetical protein
MPNILKRPMFRKGGSVAEGTGITSGLTNRKRFADGSDENDYSDENFYNELLKESLNEIDSSRGQTSGTTARQQIDPEYIKSLYQQLRNETMPTQSQRLADYLTAFGASGAGPTDLQTWGSALGRTGQLYTQIEQPKEREASKYGAQAALMGLRGLSKSPVVDESERKARLAADNRDAPNSKYRNMSYDEAYAAAYNDIINKKTLVREYSMEKSPKAQIELKAKDYEKQGLQTVPAKELAEIEYQINNNPKYEDEKARWQGSLLTSYVERTPTGTYKLKENIRQGPVGKKYKANDLFYDPNDRTVYMYKGPASGEFVPYSMNKK